MGSLTYDDPCKPARRAHVFEMIWCKTHGQALRDCATRKDLARKRTPEEEHAGAYALAAERSLQR